MSYRFTARSTTPGEYRFASGVLANLIALGDIQQGVNRGDGGVGTFAVPAVADVESGVSYGADGTEFTGTLDVAGGSGTIGIVGLRRVT